MATVTKTAKRTKKAQLGPLDDGLPMTLDEFMAGDYQEGYRYELIHGRLYVSPWANMPENWVHDWLRDKVREYAFANPRAINYVTGPGRIFVPVRPGVTVPEPDMLVYKNFPRNRRKRELRWEDFSPILVGEVLSANDPHKDLVRNVALYVLVPSIKEYWILDVRKDADYPTMLIYRRRGKHWHDPNCVGPNETYTTPLLPGFRLTLDTSE